MAKTSVLHSLGSDEDARFRRLKLEAIRKFPAEPILYTSMANHLLPRWHGGPGEWQAFADTVTATLPDSVAEEFYARIVLRMATYGEDVFGGEGNADWRRVQRGLDRWQRRLPLALPPRGGRAMLASMAGDRATARAAFAALRDTCDLEVWQTLDRYWGARRWAEGSGP